MKALMGKKKKKKRATKPEANDVPETMDLASIMDLKRQTAWDADDALVKGQKSNRLWSKTARRPNRESPSESAKHLLDDHSEEGHVEYQEESIPKSIIASDKDPSVLVLNEIADQEQPLAVAFDVSESSESTRSSSIVVSPARELNRDPLAARRSIFNGSAAKKKISFLPTEPDSLHVPAPSPRANSGSILTPTGNTNKKLPSLPFEPDSPHVPTPSTLASSGPILSPTSDTELNALGDSCNTYNGSMMISSDGIKQRKSKMEKIRELLHENRELKETTQRLQEELSEKEARLRQLADDGGQHFTGEGTRESPDKQEKHIEALLALTATTRKQQESITAHQARYDQLREEFDSSQTEIMQLRKDIANTRKQVMTLDKEIDTNLMEIAGLRKELSEASQLIEQMEAEQKTDRAKVLNFAKELALTKAGMSGASDDIKALANEMENFDATVKQRDREIEAQRSELADHMEHIQQLQLDLERTLEQVEDYERERDNTVAEMETYYEALKHELEEKNRLLEEAEREKLELKSETTESLSALQERIGRLNADLLEARRVAKHDHERCASKNEFEEERERLNANLEAMSTELDKMAEHYEELELEQINAYQELEEEVGELRIQLTDFKAALREATVRNRTLTEKNEMLKVENTSLMELSQDLQKKLRQEQSKNELAGLAASSAVLAGHDPSASSQTEKKGTEEIPSHHADTHLSETKVALIEGLRKQNAELRHEVDQLRALNTGIESSSSSHVYSIGGIREDGAERSEPSDSNASRSSPVVLDSISENKEIGLIDIGMTRDAASNSENRAAVGFDAKMNDSSRKGLSDDVVVNDSPSPASVKAGQQELFLQAAADRQTQRRNSEKMNMANKSWRSMKLFSNSSHSPDNDRSSSSPPPPSRDCSNSLPTLAGSDNSSADSSSAVDSSVVDVLKDQVIEGLEKANEAHQQTISDLKSELVRLNASYKSEAYLSKKKIEDLTQENSAYEIKIVVLEKMLEKLGGPVDSYSSTAHMTEGVTLPATTADAEDEAPQRDWSSPPKFHDRIKELEEKVDTLEREKHEVELKMQAVESDLESFQHTTKQSSIASIREIERLQQQNAEYERKLAILVETELEATEGSRGNLPED